jgi:hypothetical protein
MSISTSFVCSIRKLGLVGIFMLAAMNSFAGDSERITQLEKEIQELKTRLSRLESPQGGSSAPQKPVASADGWKSISNWRALKSGMSPDEVRATLGEPARVRGGDLAIWSYANRGEVVFINDKVTSWREPL